MRIDHRCKLLYGPYKMPQCQLGKKLFCEIRGWIQVKRISDGRIPWPQTIIGGSRTFIICGDLGQALRREANLAICFWWGITPQTVTAWRKALDIGPITEGTAKLLRVNAKRTFTEEVRRKAVAAASSPEANAKKAAYRRGKPAHPNALKALARFWGKRPSKETRRRLSEAARRRDASTPSAGRPWTEKEKSLLGKVPDKEVVARTGRTIDAVRSRRVSLGRSPVNRKEAK
jgi:hypothetical protein